METEKKSQRGKNTYRELEELVRYVSCRVAQCLSRGVRENHRSNRDLQSVTGGLRKSQVSTLDEDGQSPELSCGRGQLSSQVGSFPLSGSEKFPSALVGSCTIHRFNFAPFPPMMINSALQWVERINTEHLDGTQICFFSFSK